MEKDTWRYCEQPEGPWWELRAAGLSLLERHLQVLGARSASLSPDFKALEAPRRESPGKSVADMSGAALP